MFVSGSHDRTIRFWDLRTRGCVNVVTPNTSVASRVSIHFIIINITAETSSVLEQNNNRYNLDTTYCTCS